VKILLRRDKFVFILLLCLLVGNWVGVNPLAADFLTASLRELLPFPNVGTGEVCGNCKELKMHYPACIWISKFGDIYITDSKNDRVLLLKEIDGKYTLVEEYKFSPMREPVGIWAYSNKIVVASKRGNKVVVFTQGGKLLGQCKFKRKIKRPRGVVYYKGRFYVADTPSNRVWILDEDFNLIGALQKDVYGPRGVAVKNNVVYVANSLNSTITGYSVETGAKVFSYKIKGAKNIRYLAFDKIGRIYVTDQNGKRGENGILWCIDPVLGKNVKLAEGLRRPEGIFITNDTRIFVVEGDADTFRMFRTDSSYQQVCWAASYLNVGMYDEFLESLKNAYEDSQYKKFCEKVILQLKGNIGEKVIAKYFPEFVSSQSGKGNFQIASKDLETKGENKDKNLVKQTGKRLVENIVSKSKDSAEVQNSSKSSNMDKKSIAESKDTSMARKDGSHKSKGDSTSEISEAKEKSKGQISVAAIITVIGVLFAIGLILLIFLKKKGVRMRGGKWDKYK